MNQDQAELSIPTSSSMGQLAGASTIAEEGGEAAASDGEGVVGADSHHSSNGGGLPVSAGGQRQAPAAPAPAHQQLSEIHVDSSSYHGSGGGGPPVGQISPASDFRRGSMSPGVPAEERCVRVGVHTSSPRWQQLALWSFTFLFSCLRCH